MKGSWRQPHPETGDGMEDAIQEIGILSSQPLDAEDLQRYKRAYWAIENGLHKSLDEYLGEDHDTSTENSFRMGILRRIGYNLIKLFQRREYPCSSMPMAQTRMGANIKSLMPYLMNPIPAF